MRKSKQAGWPTITYDSMLLRAALNTGERLALKEIVERAYGKCTCVTVARATRAAMILFGRRHLSLCRQGRSVKEVRCLDNGPYKYMQLEACVYLMVVAAIQSAAEQMEPQ